MEESDQTQNARMICRSLACLRMELYNARIASSQKLRQEWDKRLENNSLAVDRLQENRELWLCAGGPDPEQLATPTEIDMEEVSKTLGTLAAMLEMHGPTGGLDSFVEEIKALPAHTYTVRACHRQRWCECTWHTMTTRRPPGC